MNGRLISFITHLFTYEVIENGPEVTGNKQEVLGNERKFFRSDQKKTEMAGNLQEMTKNKA